MSRLIRIGSWVLCSAWVLAAGAVHAQQPGAPVVVAPPLAPLAGADRPVLLVQAPSGSRSWSVAQLEALGLKRVTTRTFWPDDGGTYEGPLLVDVLRASGLEHAPHVRVAALDGYSQRIPRADWARWPIMLATRKSGKAMNTREKGPLRIIYPRDMDPELSDGVYRLRWVWLVSRIDTQTP